MYRAWNRANGRSPQGDQLTGHRCVFGIIMLGWLRTGFRYPEQASADREERARARTSVQNPEHFTRGGNIRSKCWDRIEIESYNPPHGEITFHRRSTVLSLGHVVISMRAQASSLPDFSFACPLTRDLLDDVCLLNDPVCTKRMFLRYDLSLSLSFFFSWKRLDYDRLDFLYYFIVNIRCLNRRRFQFRRILRSDWKYLEFWIDGFYIYIRVCICIY